MRAPHATILYFHKRLKSIILCQQNLAYKTMTSFCRQLMPKEAKREKLQTLTLGHQQKVGIQVGRSEKVGFYKGTFRAQTGTIVHSRNFLVLFRP